MTFVVDENGVMKVYDDENDPKQECFDLEKRVARKQGIEKGQRNKAAKFGQNHKKKGGRPKGTRGS